MTTPPPIIAAPNAPPSPALPTPPKRRRWLTWLLAGLIFVAGGIVGGGVTVGIILHHVQLDAQDPQRMPAAVAGRVANNLDLTPEQREQVRAIIFRHMEELRRDRVTELRGINQEVQQVLTPRQRLRWDRLFFDFTRHWLPPGAAGEASATDNKPAP